MHATLCYCVGRCYDDYNNDNMVVGHGYGSADPLFRFGFGMSYTTFALSDFKLAKNSHANTETKLGFGDADPATASVVVENTGTVIGSEVHHPLIHPLIHPLVQVIQIYVEDPVMEYVRPWKRLVAFMRVADLKPGEKRTVTIPITADELAFHDDSSQVGTLRVVPGEYAFTADTSSNPKDYKPVVVIF
jgi:beta-glucosidase